MGFIHAGMDYVATGVRPDSGANSNLRFRSTRNTPNNAFIVMIMDDDTPEPIEVIDVFLECEAVENCYAPQDRYTITIVDPDGTVYLMKLLHAINILVKVAN